MFIQKIQNFLLSNVNIAHASSDDAFCGFAESRMVFMGSQTPQVAPKVKNKPASIPSQSEQIKELRGRLKAIKAAADKYKGKVDHSIFKPLEKRIDDLEAKLKKDKDVVIKGTLRGINKALDHGDKVIGPGFNSKTIYKKQKKAADKARLKAQEKAEKVRKAAVKKKKKTPKKTPTNQPKAKKNPENKSKLTKKQRAKLAKVKAEALRKAAEKARISNNAAMSILDLANGVPELDAKSLDKVLAKIKPGEIKKMKIMKIPVATWGKIGKDSKINGLKYNEKNYASLDISIEKSANGGHTRILIKSKPGANGEYPDGFNSKAQTREFYLHNGSMRIKPLSYISKSKIEFKHSKAESMKQTPASELSELLNIVGVEGKAGFNRYYKKIQNVIAKFGATGKEVDLPGGYRIVAPKWSDGSRKPKVMIFKGTEVAMTQMQDDSLRYAEEIPDGESTNDLQRGIAETWLAQTMSQKAFNNLTAIGKGDDRFPRFSSMKDLVNLQTSLVKLATFTQKTKHKFSITLSNASIEWEKDNISSNHGRFTIRAKGFTMYFDSRNLGVLGAEEPDENGQIVRKDYNMEEFTPTEEEMAKANTKKIGVITSSPLPKKGKEQKTKPTQSLNKPKKMNEAQAKTFLEAKNKTRKEISTHIEKNIQASKITRTILDGPIIDTWNSKVKPQDIIKNPDKYKHGKMRGKFVLQIKKRLTRKENRVKIHELLGLNEKTRVFGRNNGVLVEIGNSKGIWYPGDETVYKLDKNGFQTDQRLKFKAGDKIEVSSTVNLEVKLNKLQKKLRKLKAELKKKYPNYDELTKNEDFDKHEAMSGYIEDLEREYNALNVSVYKYYIYPKTPEQNAGVTKKIVQLRNTWQNKRRELNKVMKKRDEVEERMHHEEDGKTSDKLDKQYEELEERVDSLADKADNAYETYRKAVLPNSGKVSTVAVKPAKSVTNNQPAPNTSRPVVRRSPRRTSVIRKAPEKSNAKKALAFNTQGDKLWDQGKHNQAFKVYDKAIKLAPNNSIYRYNRGYANFTLGRTEAALKDYNSAIRISPKYSLYYKYRGKAYKKLGNTNKANADFAKAKALAAKNTNKKTSVQEVKKVDVKNNKVAITKMEGRIKTMKIQVSAAKTNFNTARKELNVAKKNLKTASYQQLAMNKMLELNKAQQVAQTKYNTTRDYFQKLAGELAVLGRAMNKLKTPKKS